MFRPIQITRTGWSSARRPCKRCSSSTAALADLTTCGPVAPCTPFSTESFIERANLGLYHWFAVKQWQVVEGYGLQTQPTFHGSVDSNGNWVGQGEARGWPYSWPSVFYLAPRTLYAPESTASGTRVYYFSWEKRLVSYYRTNQWDELQVVLAAGWPGASNGAVDWPSNLGSITALADDLISANAPAPITAAHLARYFANAGKLAQLANTDLPFDAPAASDPTNLYANAGMQSKADLLFKLSPAILLDSDAATPSRFRLLDQITPGLYLLFVNGMLSSYDTLFTGTARSQYRLCDPNNTQLGGPEPSSGMRILHRRRAHSLAHRRRRPAVLSVPLRQWLHHRAIQRLGCGRGEQTGRRRELGPALVRLE